MVVVHAVFDRVLRDPASLWYAPEGMPVVFRKALTGALAELRAGKLASPRLMLGHLLLGGKLPRWLGFDRGPIVLKGTRATVQQGQVFKMGERTSSFAPSLRFITDMAEEAIHTIIPGGPSDRRFGPYYATELARWRRGS